MIENILLQNNDAFPIEIDRYPVSLLHHSYFSSNIHLLIDQPPAKGIAHSPPANIKQNPRGWSNQTGGYQVEKPPGSSQTPEQQSRVGESGQSGL